MAARNLLHKTKLEEFKEFLVSQGHEWRETQADYQVIQIRLKNKTAWHAVYEKLNAKEHYSVTSPLVGLVESYIEGMKKLKETPPAQSQSDNSEAPF